MNRKFLFVMTLVVFALGFSTAGAQKITPKVNPNSSPFPIANPCEPK